MHKQLTISAALIERDEKFLLLRRVKPEHPEWHQRWEFCGGKIEPNETPLDALHREVFEEAQLIIHSPRLLGVHTNHWNTPTGIQQTFILLYHCYAPEGEVVVKPDEHDDVFWATAEELLQKENLLGGTEEMFQNLFLNQRQLMCQP